MAEGYTLLGPFTQLLSLAEMPLRGGLKDEHARPQEQAGLLIKDGRVFRTGPYHELRADARTLKAEIIEYTGTYVCMPAFVDAHTHICFGGSRASDYAMRNEGRSYLEIARAGGGIWDTVSKTRACSEAQLEAGILKRLDIMAASGIATVEIKSGYGLSLEEELKMLRAIASAAGTARQDIVSTCLAAHIKPRDFDGTHKEYLEYIASKLLPIVKEENLATRVDAFVEEEAFSPGITRPYLQKAKEMGFDLCIHADQFSTGGSALAVELGARSADHLEASTDREIELLAGSHTIAMALPGASIGLGCAFTPARKLLDRGAILAIASDWNPGSAPMGDLLIEASVLATNEKLSNMEVLAGITFRAAAALGLDDRGRLSENQRADFIIYETEHYNEVFYHQGLMKPVQLWISGQLKYKAQI